MKRGRMTSIEGVTFEPFVNTSPGSMIGYKVTRESDGRVEYITLVPSSQTDEGDGTGNVFAYHSADPSDPMGEAFVHINFFEEDPS